MDSVHYLTEAELADRWRMSPGTLRQQRYRGRSPVPYRRVGGKLIRYALTDVVAAEEYHRC